MHKDPLPTQASLPSQVLRELRRLQIPHVRCSSTLRACGHESRVVRFSCLSYCTSIADNFCSHMLEKLNKVKCTQAVEKQLIKCEHTAKMPCHKDPITFQCKERCNGILECCSRNCKSRCFECQQESTVGKGKNRTKIDRLKHRSHPCERYLYCQHQCGLSCAKDHQCNRTCEKECRQQCSHHRCTKPCSASCAPCMEQCLWRCPHASCPVSCGSVSVVFGADSFK